MTQGFRSLSLSKRAADVTLGTEQAKGWVRGFAWSSRFDRLSERYVREGYVRPSRSLSLSKRAADVTSGTGLVTVESWVRAFAWSSRFDKLSERYARLARLVVGAG